MNNFAVGGRRHAPNGEQRPRGWDFAPNYEYSFTISSDKRVMYDILRRIRYMLGINLDLSDLEKESKQQISDFENVLKRLLIDNSQEGLKIATYMQQIKKNFQELIFKEPTKIPDVF
jgi:hypothetical protein